jgi:hypothetical protein
LNRGGTHPYRVDGNGTGDGNESEDREDPVAVVELAAKDAAVGKRAPANETAMDIGEF